MVILFPSSPPAQRYPQGIGPATSSHSAVTNYLFVYRTALGFARLFISALVLVSSVNATAGGVITVCAEDTFEIEFDRALEGGGTILIQCSGTNRLTSTKLIVVDTTIQGTAETGWLVGGGSNRLFEVVAGVELRLVNLRLAQGRAPGDAGADGTSTQDAERGQDALGGAILNDGGVVYAEDVLFHDHQAIGGTGGAGWTVTEIGLTPTAGGSGGHAWGGAIFNRGGRVELTDCQFDSNQAIGGPGGSGGSSGTFPRDGAPGGAGGGGWGGAVYHTGDGHVRLVRCEFRLNQAEGASGGAGGQGAGLIHFDGAIGNSAAGRGGAVSQNGGELHLSQCTFSRNEVVGAAGIAANLNAGDRDEAAGGHGFPGQGGAVYLEPGFLQVVSSSFSDNTAQGGAGGDGGLTGGGGHGGDGGEGALGQGGALFLGANTDAVVSDSSFSYNGAFGGFGGFGSPGANELAIPGTDGKAGNGEGGATWFSGLTLSVVQSLFEHNRSQGAEGLAGSLGTNHRDGSGGNQGGSGLGGAVFGRSGNLALTNTTFLANETVGGLGGHGGDGSPSGVFATDGGQGGPGGAALGAALWLQSAPPAHVVHCTFATNRVVAGEGGLGGAAGDPDLARAGDDGRPGTAAGGAVGAAESLVLLRHTLLAHSIGGTEAVGPIRDAGCNLSTDGTPVFETSMNGVDPMLADLAERGGPTRTIALQAGSPAIDITTCNHATPVDQRGLLRDAFPDAGAYEVGAGVPQVAVALTTAGIVEVAWPDFGVVYTLESSASVPPTWTTTEGSVSENGWWIYRPQNSAGQGYYRLLR